MTDSFTKIATGLIEAVELAQKFAGELMEEVRDEDAPRPATRTGTGRTGRIEVVKDGVLWDKDHFERGDYTSMGVAMANALDWRDKILREEPEAKVQIKVKGAK